MTIYQRLTIPTVSKKRVIQKVCELHDKYVTMTLYITSDFMNKSSCAVEKSSYRSTGISVDQRTSSQMLVSSISVNEQRDTSVSIDENQSLVNRKHMKRKNDRPLKETVSYENLLTSIRYGVSNRATAAIATSRKKRVFSQILKDNSNLWPIKGYFDGRRDNTICQMKRGNKYYRATKERHTYNIMPVKQIKLGYVLVCQF
ncbi:hypothetical protein TSAR_008015 [Trichomalopsis sarcophagae]|uniref:Uncharacterized protein n=1 Tax=Trichomalopsis sarcophagae TaxID=543379 RepID=A0A232FNA6_9HYME|nr:hypothetical protein TSAR_008015 [Trichomalopsis sarcophagae]